jgi:hypothetical protein
MEKRIAIAAIAATLVATGAQAQTYYPLAGPDDPALSNGYGYGYRVIRRPFIGAFYGWPSYYYTKNVCYQIDTMTGRCTIRYPEGAPQ